MNRLSIIIVCFWIAAVLIIGGCSSSEESTKQKESPTSTTTQQPPEETIKTEAAAPAKTDTVNVVNVQDTPKPTYEPNTTQQTGSPSATSAGVFAVQIGAYKTEENAERASALAKERFGLIVQTISDKSDLLFKVLVGSFSTRDEARKFRDDITQKYPLDYKDAWVKDMSQK